MDKLTYTIDQIARAGPLSRSKIYEEIAAGRLKARKAGRRTVILAQDYQAYLEALPVMAGTLPKGKAGAGSIAPTKSLSQSG